MPVFTVTQMIYDWTTGSSYDINCRNRNFDNTSCVLIGKFDLFIHLCLHWYHHFLPTVSLLTFIILLIHSETTAQMLSILYILPLHQNCLHEKSQDECFVSQREHGSFDFRLGHASFMNDYLTPDITLISDISVQAFATCQNRHDRSIIKSLRVKLCG